MKEKVSTFIRERVSVSLGERQKGMEGVAVSPGKVGFPNAGSGSKALPSWLPASHTTHFSLSNNNEGNAEAGCGFQATENAIYNSISYVPTFDGEASPYLGYEQRVILRNGSPDTPPGNRSTL